MSAAALRDSLLPDGVAMGADSTDAIHSRLLAMSDFMQARATEQALASMRIASLEERVREKANSETVAVIAATLPKLATAKDIELVLQQLRTLERDVQRQDKVVNALVITIVTAFIAAVVRLFFTGGV